ncbi:MAG TPA: glycerol kinase GlpK [Spirochaetales bacterium]|nr:glycerol kinase GlpK [Spirochaetales bacterium]
MTQERYILALDQGTTSSRAIVFNASGVSIGQKQIPFRQIYPQPGWVEHDPQDLWISQLEAARGAIEAAQVRPQQIAAIGISNQRETTLLWEKATGKPVHNAIVWQCRRSSSICHELKAMGYEEDFHKRTGLVLDPYFSASKLMWLFSEIPGLRVRAERGEILFGTVDSWLIYNLTGRHATDATNASRTLLFNIYTGQWDDDILRTLNIPKAILPEVLPSSYEYGLCKPELFGAAIPVCGCAGDQQAALFGHACFQPGAAKNTYGTGCFALMNTGTEAVMSGHSLLTTVAWDLGKGYSYALEGSVFIAGAVVQWLRDELAVLADSAESERLARSVPDSGGVVLVPAFVGMGAPYWDADARGAVLGITRGTSRAHLVRAALEAIAYQSRDLLQAMERDYGSALPFLKADGGASANSFLMQFQADVMDRPVILPETAEVSALGAAYLAGLTVGYWSGLPELECNWRRKREFNAEMAEETRVRLLERWDKAVSVARMFK